MATVKRVDPFELTESEALVESKSMKEDVGLKTEDL